MLTVLESGWALRRHSQVITCELVRLRPLTQLVNSVHTVSGYLLYMGTLLFITKPKRLLTYNPTPFIINLDTSVSFILSKFAKETIC